jgi:pimeloyl-ACP methyl ester carboxylesterase
MPGFGTSRGPKRLRSVGGFADALLELVDDLGAPVDLVGNSFGTQIALAAAARRPAAARRLVLIGPTFDRAARRYPRMIARWLTVMPLEPPALGLSLARSYAKSGIRTPALALRAGMRDAPERNLAVLPHPVLLVRGTRDRIAPRAWLEELQQCAAAAEIAEVPGVAHTVDFAAPEPLAEITREFLDR